MISKNDYVLKKLLMKKKKIKPLAKIFVVLWYSHRRSDKKTIYILSSKKYLRKVHTHFFSF